MRRIFIFRRRVIVSFSVAGAGYKAAGMVTVKAKRAAGRRAGLRGPRRQSARPTRRRSAWDDDSRFERQLPSRFANCLLCYQ